MPNFLREFKEFATRGNVVDLAVGVVIGGAFGKIVSAFVEDVIMPPIGILIGGIDFRNLEIAIKPGVAIKYGLFLQSVVDFIIIAFAIFIAMKAINGLHKNKDTATPQPTAVESLLTEIRDLLKKK